MAYRGSHSLSGKYSRNRYLKVVRTDPKRTVGPNSSEYVVILIKEVQKISTVDVWGDLGCWGRLRNTAGESGESCNATHGECCRAELDPGQVLSRLATIAGIENCKINA
jgi:hypothetical protein